ncbi:MAG: hypothetical protein AAF456_16385 [Planctomycetota bacterium]
MGLENGNEKNTFALNCGGVLGLAIGFAIAIAIGLYFWVPFIEENFGKPRGVGGVLLAPLFLIPLATGSAGYLLWRLLFPPGAPRPAADPADVKRTQITVVVVMGVLIVLMALLFFAAFIAIAIFSVRSNH